MSRDSPSSRCGCCWVAIAVHLEGTVVWFGDVSGDGAGRADECEAGRVLHVSCSVAMGGRGIVLENECVRDACWWGEAESGRGLLLGARGRKVR